MSYAQEIPHFKVASAGLCGFNRTVFLNANRIAELPEADDRQDEEADDDTDQGWLAHLVLSVTTSLQRVETIPRPPP